MFPTISSLTEYLFGFSFNFPLKTFGVFVALAFISAYFVFLSEFKRKEKEGCINPFIKTTEVSKPSTLLNCTLSGVISFLIGFKLFGAINNYTNFSYDPIGFIFSVKGSWLAGTILALFAVIIIYFRNKKRNDNHGRTITEKIHPYQLMPTLVLWAAFCGFIGAKLFSVLERIPQFLENPWHELTTFTGLVFYGGFIFGAIIYLIIGYQHGMKLIHLADIGSPGMLVAYGVGRIGCQLAGDGDWGIINTSPKPGFLAVLPDWMWSFKFPHNVLNMGEFIPQCQKAYCMVLAKGVYPTSFYETVIILSSFMVLWTFRKKIKTPGLMFTLFLIINGIERFFIEYIRVNPEHDFMGLSLTQAQIIALIFFVGGFLGLLFILFKRRSSPHIILK